MNPKKTNYIYYIESFFGIKLLEILPKLARIKRDSEKTQSQYFIQNFITNPFLKFIFLCARKQGNNLTLDMSRLCLQDGASEEFVYVKFLGHLLNFLNKEFENNKNYKEETSKKLLRYDAGGFYTAFCELFIGGYLKFNDCSINFNSSLQDGSPDVIVDKPFSFANESKVFPDSEYWLLDKLNKNKSKLLTILKSFSNEQIIVMVSSLDKFDEELEPFLQNFLNLRKDQKGQSIWVVGLPFRLDSTQGYVIDFPQNNSSIRIVPSFKLTDEAIQRVVDKAEKQFTNAKLPGIVWLAFPRPKEVSMERLILGLASQIPKVYQKKNLGMMLYDFMPARIDKYRAGVRYTLDVFTDRNELSFINKNTFDSNIKEISDKPTILLA